MSLSDLQSNRYRVKLTREDVLKKANRTVVLDLASQGRLVSEQFEEDLPGAGRIPFETRYHYRDDFHHGQVPSRSETLCGESGETALGKTTTL
ncbi:MAG: hypothetical protein GWO24_28165, partial [Akkermansiaceae bacterium]|nr:hypothetical protein [Akkermansiaceae bacterium]